MSDLSEFVLCCVAGALALGFVILCLAIPITIDDIKTMEIQKSNVCYMPQKSLNNKIKYLPVVKQEK